MRRQSNADGLPREWSSRGFLEKTLQRTGSRTRRPPRPLTSPRGPLLVEPDPARSDLLSRAFRGAGLSEPLRVAGGAEDVRALLRDATYVFLEAEPPEMSGLDLLEELGKGGECLRVPFLVLSSSTDPEHVERAFGLGARAYLLKPRGFDALTRLVASVHRFWSDPIAGAR